MLACKVGKGLPPFNQPCAREPEDMKAREGVCGGVGLMSRTLEPAALDGAEVLIEATHPWHRITADGRTVHVAGDAGMARRILATPELARGPLTDLLLTQGSQFAAVLEADGTVLACVDAVRSIPLFYVATGTGLSLSNNPRRLLSRVRGTLDDTGLLEMYHAGYVTGENTLYEGIRQLQAGSALLFGGRTGELVSWAYHAYMPQLSSSDGSSMSSLVEALGEILDQCFQRVIERVGDRQVYLPLSGGLDSRLIACKLHEHGFTRIKAFTYGPPGNSQSLVARRVAECLDLDWLQVPFDVRRMRDIFHSEARVRYQHFADGLSTLPSMGDFCPLIQLDCADPGDVVVVNGQSGDFISGNHLPVHLLEKGDDGRLWEHIRSKHFGVRPPGTPGLDPIEERFRARQESLTLEEGLENPLATRHENWEFRERQAKYVVNGQRLYEFLGMDWLLPWWDFELVRFFEGVPLQGYVHRQLLQAYLRQYDYKGLFTAGFPAPRAFAGWEGRLWETGLGALRQLGVGVPVPVRRISHYRSGYYRSYFQLYPFSEYMQRSGGSIVDPQARSATALVIDQWLEDVNLLPALARAQLLSHTG